MLKRKSKNSVKRFISKQGSDWVEIKSAELGNSNGVVNTGTPGLLYARNSIGQEFKVFNEANVPATYGLKVKIGKHKITGNWKIIEARGNYATPSTRGLVGVHALQHLLRGGDPVFIERVQLLSFTILPSGNATIPFSVKLYGGYLRTSTSKVLVGNQLVDLSSHVVTSGAIYVNVEVDEDGVVSLNPGTAFDSKFAASVEDIPDTADDKFFIGAVLLYESQDSITIDDILVPATLSKPGGSGTISEEYVRRTEHVTDPTEDDDSDENYLTGHLWIKTDTVQAYICLSDTPGAAVWMELDTFTAADVYAILVDSVDGSPQTGISVSFNPGTGQYTFVTEVTQSELDTTNTNISNHIADSSDAHDASAISVDDSSFSNIEGANVQAMMADIDSQIGAGGGLAYNAVTVTTGNVTAVSGNHYDCTIGGMTANRNFDLPTPSAAGEECAVRVRDGDDTYALIIRANSVEITRLFIAGEFMQFMSYGTGAGDWQVKIDKRIPCLGYAERQATQNISNNTLTKIALDASVIDQGNIVDVTTNDRINIRRAGRYDLTGFTSIDNLESNDNLQSLIHVNGAEFWRNIMWSSYGGSNNAETCQAGPKLYQASIGDYVELYIKFLEGAAQNTLTGGRSPGLLVKEIL